MTTKPIYTPALRFPDFLNDGEWRFVHGNELFEPIVNKNHNSELPVLAITQDQGAVPRDMIDYKVIVSEKSVAGYKVVEVGDFIISLRSFQGGIEYSNYKGLCSPAYIILRKKDDSICNDFYRYYFKSSRFIKDLNRNLEGIRDGKMISYQQFSEIMLPFPPLSEQRRIAQALTALDELIAATNEKLEQMKAYKKGLMQQLFVDSMGGGKSLKINYLQIPKLRFPEFYEEKEWEEKKLGDYLYEHKTKSDGKCQVYSVSVTKGVINQMEYLGRSFASSDTSNYKLVKPFDIVYTKSPTGEFPYGIIKQSLIGHNVIVSPLYGVFSPSNQYIGYIIHSYFESSTRTNNYLAPIVQKGAKNTIQISNDVFLSQNVCLPSNENEQRKIASCLSAMDETINAYTEKVGLLGQYKKGLMQQMFPQNQMN